MKLFHLSLLLLLSGTGFAATVPDRAWSFYASGLMQNESGFFSRDVAPRTVRLLFQPIKVLSVRSANHAVTYEEGKDYEVDYEKGLLRLTSQSQIPCTRLYGGEGEGYQRFKNSEGEGMFFGEADLYHQRQVVVRYEHAGTGWEGEAFLPKPQPEVFPRTHARVRDEEPVRVALLGDSISVGYNASGFIKVAPHLPAFGQQVAEAIGEASRSESDFLNVSRGGATARWGRKHLPEVIRHSPDLVMIAFGMNDGRRPGKEAVYEKQVRAIIEGLRDGLPEVEIMLVANMLPNEEFSPHSGHLANRKVLYKLAAEYEKIAVADVMAVTQAMLKRKKFADLCGNGVNHPNDFLHQVYASVIMETLGL
ncbi:hypothetical protein DDZ13_04475 [Coraliomargarita sinensis]|uniref:SGNH hydrolase-type esterase domain-containing protein n=1 Tax=Coraliomargarita sinensis TaxID=2174842 RepID=A0A317ZJP5_9BACT|nr:SGNH/GDSL hydrolase family protein [Coraliomargarita sinensis]PXA05222.1 hypothetical protein DDZ13_04475 [Coraliomargarita sinensis]